VAGILAPSKAVVVGGGSPKTAPLIMIWKVGRRGNPLY
jgi:hypothetical protein